MRIMTNRDVNFGDKAKNSDVLLIHQLRFCHLNSENIFLFYSDF